MRILLLLALAAALPASAPAWPQPKPPVPAPTPTNDDSTKVSGVTVEAHKEEFPTVVDKFVRQGLRDGPHGNLIRWMTPICLGVSGPSREMNLAVYQRILDVADEAGAAVAPFGCGPANVFVVFSTEPNKALEDFKKRHKSMLDIDRDPDAKRKLRFAPPMLLVQRIQNSPMGGYGTLQINTTRLQNDMATEYFSSVVIADPGALGGEPINLIADHIAERVLATPFMPRGCMPLPSVLDALDPACPDHDTVEAITDYDKALLKGLYHSDPNLSVEFERTAVREELLRDSRPPGTGR